MGTLVFSLLVGASIASFGGALLELLAAYRERSVARARAMRDRDLEPSPPGLLTALLYRDVADGFPGEGADPGSAERRDMALRIRLFTVGLIVSSFFSLSMGLGLGGSFVLILTASLLLSMAPSISKHAGLLALLLVLGLGACESQGPRRNQIQGTHNMWVNRDLRRRQVEAAVVAESTLGERHFETGGAELNELGQRDARILAEQLREHGGEVVVRRGSASEELYGERLHAVSLALLAAAPDGLTLEIEDGAVRAVSKEPR